MSACENCGATFEADESRCQICGAERRREASVLFSLTSLRPEAEPPLPAAHDELRSRTPLKGIAQVQSPTRVEKHISERSLAALAPLSTPLPMTVPPPRNIDIEVGADQPSWAQPSLPPPVVSEIPSLTGGGSWMRRSLVVVLLCLGAGAVVGWLLSQPEPPTSDEIRSQKQQP
ncbi:MAG: hypothetical protein ABI321_09340 [Polyangia bacterium]